MSKFIKLYNKNCAFYCMYKRDLIQSLYYILMDQNFIWQVYVHMCISPDMLVLHTHLGGEASICYRQTQNSLSTKISWKLAQTRREGKFTSVITFITHTTFSLSLP